MDVDDPSPTPSWAGSLQKATSVDESELGPPVTVEGDPHQIADAVSEAMEDPEAIVVTAALVRTDAEGLGAAALARAFADDLTGEDR